MPIGARLPLDIPADRNGILEFHVAPEPGPGELLPTLAKLLIGMRRRRLEREAGQQAAADAGEGRGR